MKSRLRFGELPPRIVDPRDGGGQHIQRVAGEVDDARFGEEFGQRFDLGAESGILGDEIFFACGVHVTLQHGSVEGHDAAFVFGAERFVEMLVVGHFVHEGEEEGDEVSVPNEQVDVFIFFRLEEGDGVNLQFAERGVVKFVEQAVQSVAEIFGVDPRYELRDLLLCDRGRQVDVPCGQAGEGLRVAGKQAVQEG